MPRDQCAICGNDEFWEVVDKDKDQLTKSVKVSDGKTVKSFSGQFKKIMCNNCMNIQEYFEMAS